MPLPPCRPATPCLLLRCSCRAARCAAASWPRRHADPPLLQPGTTHTLSSSAGGPCQPAAAAWTAQHSGRRRWMRLWRLLWRSRAQGGSLHLELMCCRHRFGPLLHLRGPQQLPRLPWPVQRPIPTAASRAAWWQPLTAQQLRPVLSARWRRCLQHQIQRQQRNRRQAGVAASSCQQPRRAQPQLGMSSRWLVPPDLWQAARWGCGRLPLRASLPRCLLSLLRQEIPLLAVPHRALRSRAARGVQLMVLACQQHRSLGCGPADARP